MGTFNIIAQTSNATFEFKDTNIIVQGYYVKDALNGNLQSIHGDCYRNVNGNMGDNFGYFNGYPQPNEEIDYDLSAMKRSDSNIVWDAIDDIESQVLPVDE